MSLKNSRQNRGLYTVVNPAAKARLEKARALLKQQHGEPMLTGRYDVAIACYYSDRRSHLDSDAVAVFCFEALQKSVVPDDSPKYLRDVTVKARVSRVKQDLLEISLTEVFL